MGAWGYGAFDNDEAGEWLAPMSGQIYDAIQKAYRTVGDEPFLRRTNVALAAIGLMIVGPDEFGDPDAVYAGTQVIDRMLELDEPVVMGWKDPNKRREVLREYRRHLKKIWARYERIRGRRKRSR